MSKNKNQSLKGLQALQQAFPQTVSHEETIHKDIFPLIDIGPNLSHEQFNTDLAQVIQRAKDNHVSHLLMTSTDWSSFQKNLAIIEQYGQELEIYTTYGLHPHYSQKSAPIFKNIEQNLAKPEVKAIGEFGLDYFRMLNPKETQTQVMEQFLHHARNFSHLPLFLHEREAFEDFRHILGTSGVPNQAVVHCFTGDKSKAKAYLDMGCYIGVTGWISDTRRNQDIVQALEYIPLDRLMIETDCPYLTPKNLPFKTYRNEPAFLPWVAQSVAQIKQCSVEEVMIQTRNNSLAFFAFDGYNKDIDNSHDATIVDSYSNNHNHLVKKI